MFHKNKSAVAIFIEGEGMLWQSCFIFNMSEEISQELSKGGEIEKNVNGLFAESVKSAREKKVYQ